MLQFIGIEAYNTLCDKIEPGIPADKRYKELVLIISDHYEPELLEILEYYRFRLKTPGRKIIFVSLTS